MTEKKSSYKRVPPGSPRPQAPFTSAQGPDPVTRDPLPPEAQDHDPNEQGSIPDNLTPRSGNQRPKRDPDYSAIPGIAPPDYENPVPTGNERQNHPDHLDGNSNETLTGEPTALLKSLSPEQLGRVYRRSNEKSDKTSEPDPVAQMPIIRPLFTEDLIQTLFIDYQANGLQIDRNEECFSTFTSPIPYLQQVMITLNVFLADYIGQVAVSYPADVRPADYEFENLQLEIYRELGSFLSAFVSAKPKPNETRDPLTLPRFIRYGVHYPPLDHTKMGRFLRLLSVEELSRLEEPARTDVEPQQGVAFASGETAQALRRIKRTYCADCIHWDDIEPTPADISPEYRTRWERRKGQCHLGGPHPQPSRPGEPMATTSWPPTEASAFCSNAKHVLDPLIAEEQKALDDAERLADRESASVSDD
jgi:hypothetical protein